MSTRFLPARTLTALAAVASLLVPGGPAAAQDDDSVETVTVREGAVYMLTGRGGNIGLSIGDDGAFLVDDKFAPMTDEIRDAVSSVGGGEVRFVLNTHWHGDHTGGNENFGEAGALVVAHENVRKRMDPADFPDLMGRSEQAPEGALPVVTFDDGVNFHWNGDEIRARHVAHAHTDGDAMVRLVEADVLHMGDLYFNGFYPFIDVESGGSIEGLIAGARTALEWAGPDTRIIPGHGPLSDREELGEYLHLLQTVRSRVQRMIDRGMSEDEVVEATPTSDFDGAWGGSDFMPPERFVRLTYRGLVRDHGGPR